MLKVFLVKSGLQVQQMLLLPTAMSVAVHTTLKIVPNSKKSQLSHARAPGLFLEIIINSLSYA